MPDKRIVKQEIHDEITAHNIALTARIARLLNIHIKVNNYVNDTELKSTGYDNSKNFMATYYLPYYGGLVRACEEHGNANLKLRDSLSILGENEDVNVPQMEEALARRKQDLTYWINEESRLRRERQSYTDQPFEDAIYAIKIMNAASNAERANRDIAAFTGVLGKVEAFENAVAHLYDRSDAMYAQLALAEADIQSIPFNPKTGVYDFPPGVPAWAAEIERLKQEGFEERVELTLARVVSYDANGNPIYNWDEINRILDKDAGAISEAEYSVLAILYANMNLEDTIRFLQALADKVGEIDGSEILRDHHPAQYTEWTYDSDKIERLQKYVDALANTVALEQWKLYSMTNEDIYAIYYQMYPDQTGRDIGIDTARRRVIDDIDERRRALLQQSAFLDIMDDLCANRTGESDYAPTSYYQVYGNLTGSAGAFGPQISITSNNKDGYIFSFCNTEKTTTYTQCGNVGDAEIIIPVASYDHLHSNYITVSDVLPAAKANEEILQNMETFFSVKYANSSFDETIMNGINNSIRGKGISMLFPAAGSGISFLLGLTTGLVGVVADNKEAAQNLSDINQSTSALRQANYCVALKLDATVISDGTAGPRVIIYPTPKTQAILSNINKYIGDEGVELSPHGLSFPITMNDVFNKSNEIYEFLMSGMSSSDFVYITDPHNWRP